MNIKKELYTIFENPVKHQYGIPIQVFIFLNIFVSIVVLFLQTEKTLEQYFPLLNAINIVINKSKAT